MQLHYAVPFRHTHVTRHICSAAALSPFNNHVLISTCRYIRKFGQQGVLEKGLSNVTRNAHSQFDILMGITQAHILSFGVVSGTEDTASIASLVRACPLPQSTSATRHDFNMYPMAWSNCLLLTLKTMKHDPVASHQLLRVPCRECGPSINIR